MLNEEDKDYLHEKVIAALRQGQMRQQLLAAAAPTELLDAITDDLNPAMLTAEVIRRCVNDRWNHQPCWILCLFNLFVAEPRSQALADRLKYPPKYGGDPVTARVLINDIPFLDRESLRSLTKPLSADRTTRPILLVSGNEKSGKSYSYDFIDHLFVCQKVGFSPLRVKFEKDDGLLFGPEQLAKEILMNMGVDVDQLSPSFFAKDTNNVKWEQQLAGKVLAKRVPGKRYWIILDNFFGDTLRTETAKFIDALARRIVDSADLAESFRLVLLQFKRGHLTVESRKVDGEDIAQITDGEVKEATREIYVRYKGNEPDEATLQTTVASILHKMPDPKDLELLNERLQLLIDELRK